MTVGFKVSKPSKDVKSVTGDDLIMDVDSTMLKVFASGTVTINATSGVQTINHGLGYLPHFLVYGQAGTTDSGNPTAFWLGTGLKPIFTVPSISAWGDSTNIYFYVGSSTNISVYYFIFYDQT